MLNLELFHLHKGTGLNIYAADHDNIETQTLIYKKVFYLEKKSILNDTTNGRTNIYRTHFLTQ